MNNPAGDRAGRRPLPPVTGTIVRMTGMARIPRMDRSTDGWPNDDGRPRRRTDSWWTNSRWTSHGRSPRDRRRSNRRLSDRRFGDRRLGNWLFRDRGLTGARGCSVSRSGWELTGGRRCRTRAGQLRSTRLEPVWHCRTRAAPGADATLNLVAIDVGPRAGTWCRWTCTATRTSRRKLTGRGSTRRRGSTDRWSARSSRCRGSTDRWRARSSGRTRSTGCGGSTHRRRAIDCGPRPTATSPTLSHDLMHRETNRYKQRYKTQKSFFHRLVSSLLLLDSVSWLCWRTTVTSGMLGCSSPATSRLVDCHRKVFGST